MDDEKRIQKENGEWIEEEALIKAHAAAYFSGLFTSDVLEPDAHVIEKIKPRVSEAMNAELNRAYSSEEVKKAMYNIGDLKAPSPDGLHAVFYKRFWHIIGEDLIDEVLLAINSRKIPEGWNNTTIVLIPKVENPNVITQSHPISLCNMVHKGDL